MEINKPFIGSSSRLDVTGEFAKGPAKGNDLESLLGGDGQPITHTAGENSGSEIESGSEGQETGSEGCERMELTAVAHGPIAHTAGENSGSEVESGSEGCEGAAQPPQLPTSCRLDSSDLSQADLRLGRGLIIA